MQILPVTMATLFCIVLSGCTVDEPPPKVEDTAIGSQLAPLNKAQNFQSEYEKALEQKRNNMDQNIDG